MLSARKNLRVTAGFRLFDCSGPADPAFRLEFCLACCFDCRKPSALTAAGTAGLPLRDRGLDVQGSKAALLEHEVNLGHSVHTSVHRDCYAGVALVLRVEGRVLDELEGSVELGERCADSNAERDDLVAAWFCTLTAEDVVNVVAADAASLDKLGYCHLVRRNQLVQIPRKGGVACVSAYEFFGLALAPDALKAARQASCRILFQCAPHIKLYAKMIAEEGQIIHRLSSKREADCQCRCDVAPAGRGTMMHYEDELRLSFYEEMAPLGGKQNITLVRHVETGHIYVRKKLTHFDREIFEFLKEGCFAGIPVIRELAEADGVLWVIEDYISGSSLAELLEQENFGEDEACAIIADLCDILEPLHAHKPPIIHRDIKSSNVIIDGAGRTFLIDFDASKLVVPGRKRDTQLIGTEEYAAPEQYGFAQSDERTDVYALGILLHELLTGRLPSEAYEDTQAAPGRGSAAPAARAAEATPNGALGRVINTATAMDPAGRYSSAAGLKRAVLQAREIKSEAPGLLSRLGLRPSRLLKALLAHLPKPLRELPGFRYGNPLIFALSFLWYLFLVMFGLLGIASNPEYSAAYNTYINLTAFAMLFTPTLYLGNYLGIRDRLPWPKRDNILVDILRIAAGFIILIAILSVIIAEAGNKLGF